MSVLGLGRLIDWLDYWVWDVRQRSADAVHGPMPETDRRGF